MSRIKTMEDYREAKPIVLPFHSEKLGFELRGLDCVCPTCGKALVDFRGDIHEVFSCIEMDLGGVCHECKRVEVMRARIYPKDGRLLQENINGKWEAFVCRKNQSRAKTALRFALSCMLPACAGMVFAAVVVCSNHIPPLLTWMWWGVCLVGIFGMAFGVAYFVKK